jgi:predicted acetyltransferase
MMIRLGYARDKDLPQIMRLWKEAFGDEEPYTSWYFKTIYQPQRTCCLYLDDCPVSVIQFAPYQLCLQGKELPVAYLVGVCTDRLHQHQGYASSLMKFVIEQLREEFALLMLYTDIPGFYLPFGFSHCYHLRRFYLPQGESTTIAGSWRLGRIDEEDIAIYSRIYRQMTANLDGYIKRSSTHWHHYLSDYLSGRGGLYLSDRSYLLWFINEDNQAQIKEIGYSESGQLHQALALAQAIAKRENLGCLLWDAPLATDIPGLDSETIPHVMAMDCRLKGTAAEIIRQTQELFANSNRLWVNEIT